MAELRKYGVSTDIIFPLIDRGALDFVMGVTSATGDIKISKNGAATANTTNQLSEIGNGLYKLTLTATEMQAAKIAISIIDQTNPKEWEDQCILIDTYGNASAEHAFDLNTASQVVASVAGSVGGNVVGTVAGIVGTIQTLDALNAGLPATIKAITGLTEGGTWSLAKIFKVFFAVLAGKWQDKIGVSGTYQLLDSEDGTTVIAELVAKDDSPYTSFNVLI